MLSAIRRLCCCCCPRPETDLPGAEVAQAPSPRAGSSKVLYELKAPGGETVGRSAEIILQEVAEFNRYSEIDTQKSIRRTSRGSEKEACVENLASTVFVIGSEAEYDKHIAMFQLCRQNVGTWDTSSYYHPIIVYMLPEIDADAAIRIQEKIEANWGEGTQKEISQHIALFRAVMKDPVADAQAANSDSE